MLKTDSASIIQEYFDFLENKSFPCIGARAALAQDQIKCLVADHLSCPKDDPGILQFLYHFVDEYRASGKNYHSATILFRGPEILDEKVFDGLMWNRLQALTDLDRINYRYDPRVDADPGSANFSF